MARRNYIPEEIRQKLLNRIPPHNEQAEQAVLGSALISADCIPDLINTLDPEDFYFPANQIIFEAILILYNDHKPIDLVTLSEYLSLKGQLADVGNLEYLTSLTEATPLLRNYQYYSDIVLEKSKLRQMILSLNDVIATCYGDSEDIDEIIDLVAKKLYDIREDQDRRGFAKLGPVLAERLNYLEAFAKGGKEDMIRSGFPSIDDTLGGLKKGSLIIIAARPGMGKTALALNIAHKAAMIYQIPTAIFSLEMSKEELSNRFLSSHLSIDSRRIGSAKLTKEDWDKIAENFTALYEAPIYIDDRSGISAIEMLAKARQLKLEKNLGLIVVDYLQLMSSDRIRNDNRQQEISDISRQLKIMARELDVPVIAISQLSRACEGRGDKRPILSDLRDSGAIEQDADVVMFLYRDDYYNQDELKKDVEAAELIVAKNRHGETRTIHLGWRAEYTMFFEPEIIPLPDAPPASRSSTAGF
ncbi:MAG: replicative DNA helicase [Clostridiaceae bacterium]|nr:replicative DNA helicase [Clostridiaceae bacterium]